MPDYIEYIKELQKEWTDQRLKEFALACLRSSCEFAQKKKVEVEIQNKEDRMKGVSYKERQKYTVKLKALDDLFKQWRERGIYYSQHPPVLHELIKPEELEYVESVGVEKYLREVLTQ